MAKWGVSVFLALFFVLAGGYLARELFPRVKIDTKTVVRTVIEHATPEIIERIVYDTTEVTKWKTRILYRDLSPERVIEIPEVEIDTLIWSLQSLELSRNQLTIDALHIPTSRLLVSTWRVKNDFKVRLNQFSQDDPVIVLESRNLFDLRPRVFLGYSSDAGPFIRTQQRLWKLYVNLQAEERGLSGEGMVRAW